MKTNTKPKFIAIEGGEGSGKSSVLSSVLDKLDSQHVIRSREPGGSQYAEAIRNLALRHPLAGQASSETMLCLMFASRYDHIQQTVLPALSRGVSVISDRFDASSYAYNVHAQSAGKLANLFWELRRNLPIQPDLYIYFDVDVKEGLRRARERNKVQLEGNHFDDRDVIFHKKIKEGYGLFFKGISHVVIDANNSIEQVSVDLEKLLKKELVVG